MLRFTSVLSAFILAGCASTRPETRVVSDQLETPRAVASTAMFLTASGEPMREPSAVSAARDLETRLDPAMVLAAPGEPMREPSAMSAAGDLETRVAVAEPNSALAGLALAQEGKEKGLRENRFTIKGGYYGSSEDSIDDGYIINGAWTRFLNNWMAVEFELGYLSADGTDNGVKTDVWAIPVMVNGRANMPLWILDVYGGVGIGTFYYDAKSSGSNVRVDSEGWVLGGNAFVGASLNLVDRWALGLEAKYYVTDDAYSNTGLDAFAVMLTLGFGR